MIIIFLYIKVLRIINIMVIVFNLIFSVLLVNYFCEKVDIQIFNIFQK